MNTEFEAPIAALIEVIKTDYATGVRRYPTVVSERMRDEFFDSIKVLEGKKYLKIVAGNSVWGFVVKEAAGKFNRGDILKAASWAAPATNFARGNVFAGVTRANWTGA